MTLRELRKKTGLSSREVARRIGISQPAVIKFERNASCRLSILERHADALGVDFETVRLAAKETREQLPV